jgi:hypothetical protein
MHMSETNGQEMHTIYPQGVSLHQLSTVHCAIETFHFGSRITSRPSQDFSLILQLKKLIFFSFLKKVHSGKPF